jgi:hypothetical protein
MSYLEQLIGKAKACDTQDVNARFVAVWDLYQFLNEVKGVHVYISAGTELHKMESLISAETREEMKRRGYGFPEDFDQPTELLRP